MFFNIIMYYIGSSNPLKAAQSRFFIQQAGPIGQSVDQISSLF